MPNKGELTQQEIDLIRQWLTGDINLHGHRIQNAGQSVNPDDYMTRREVGSVGGGSSNIINPGPLLVNTASSDVASQGIIVKEAIQSVSAAANAVVASLFASASQAIIAVGKTGSAAFHPLIIETNGVTCIEVSAAAIDATHTPLFLWVNGAFKQVEVGAADSGGTGYRMLRVLN